MAAIARGRSREGGAIKCIETMDDVIQTDKRHAGFMNERQWGRSAALALLA